MEVRAARPVTWQPRYPLLDGLRGLAALAVVMNHLDVVGSATGHLAVMVFFVISGYCITASAEAHRHAGGGFGGFMLRRLRRIYPPYLLALLFFAVTRWVKFALGGPNALRRPLLDWVQNLTLTQWVSDVLHPVAEAVQNPKLFVAAFWSLNYEEQFYVVMAVTLALAARRRLPLIVPVLVLGALGLAWNWIVPGRWICGLFIEYWAHFALGCCLFFALTRYTRPAGRIAFVTLTALLGALCAARVLLLKAGDPNDVLRAMTELSFLSVVTLALFLCRPLSARICRSPLFRPLAALGTISYSLYLIHQFNLTLVAAIAHRLVPAQWPHAALTLVELSLFIALAALFWWVCERPFLRTKVPATDPASSVRAEPRAA